MSKKKEMYKERELNEGDVNRVNNENGMGMEEGIEHVKRERE